MLGGIWEDLFWRVVFSKGSTLAAPRNVLDTPWRYPLVPVAPVSESYSKLFKQKSRIYWAHKIAKNWILRSRIKTYFGYLHLHDHMLPPFPHERSRSLSCLYAKYSTLLKEEFNRRHNQYLLSYATIRVLSYISVVKNAWKTVRSSSLRNGMICFNQATKTKTFSSKRNTTHLNEIGII